MSTTAVVSENAEQPSAVHKIRKLLVWLIVAGSVAWTIYNWSGLTQIKEELDKVAIFAIMLVLTEICFVIGATMVAAGLGKSIFAGTGYNPLAWLKAIGRLRGEYHSFAERINTSTSFRIGFNLNWFGAVGTGVVALVGILVVLPATAWGLLVLPVLDIAASFGWRAPISRKLKHLRQGKSEVTVRPATLDDIEGIVELDSAMYGDEIAQGVTDDPHDMFTRRVRNSRGWFWVAEVDGKIEGMLAGQPTKYAPEEFVSWEHSTANGTFEGTYDETSVVMYVASLTVSKLGSKLDATDKLLAEGVKKAIRHGKKLAFFSARMPMYHKYKDTMSAEEYYSATTNLNGREVALDPQLRMYEELGMKRIRLVADGFVADWESCGYAVLFTFSVPFYGWPARNFWAWLFGKVADRPRLFAFCAKYV